LDDLVSLAVYHGRLGQREQALTAARQVQQATPTAKQWFQLACVHALLARASKQPGSSSDGVADSAARPAARPANEPAAAPAGQTESDIPRADIARAVYCLERALVSDGKWLSVAMVDRDLDALRDSQPFREVMEAARQRRLREAEMRR
jgi:hypothetical protein